MPRSTVGYSEIVTQRPADQDGPREETEQDIPLDPRRALDEAEERVLGGRQDEGGTGDRDVEPVEDESAEDDPGTGVDEESSG